MTRRSLSKLGEACLKISVLLARNSCQGFTRVSFVSEEATKQTVLKFVEWSELNRSWVLTVPDTIPLALSPASEDAAVHCRSREQTLEAMLQPNRSKPHHSKSNVSLQHRRL